MPDHSIPADFEISVTLPAIEWRFILDVLLDAPLPNRRTTPLIQKLGQCFEQAAASAPPPAHIGNGAAQPMRPTMPIGDGV